MPQPSAEVGERLMTSDRMRVRVLVAALCVASAAAIQPRLDWAPSLREKLEGAIASNKPFLRGAVGGAAYGLAAAAISHPFDTIKTRLQTNAAVGGGSVLSRMLGLYSGVGPAAGASILFRAVPFVGYEATRSLLRSHRLLVTARHSSLRATDAQRLTRVRASCSLRRASRRWPRCSAAWWVA